MRIDSGSTRVVLVFSVFVVKFPKLRIVRPIFRAIEHLRNSQFKERLNKFDKNNTIKAGIKYICPGLKANRIEYNYSKKHKNSDGIVSVQGLFWGLILLQRKVCITDVDNEVWKRFKRIILLQEITEVNMLTNRNFGFDQGKFKMIDYGCEGTVQVLDAGALVLIEQFI